MESQRRLNLQRNDEGIYVCKGRIQGHYPVYLLLRVTLSEIMVQDAHILTLHRGVGITMARMREHYWIPRLRQLTKSVINHCYGWKKFHASKFQNPPPGTLLVDDTEGSLHFQVIGVDYTGPTTHKMSKTKEVRAHMQFDKSSPFRVIIRPGNWGLRKVFETYHR